MLYKVEELPKDVILSILIYMDNKDILSIMTTSKKIHTKIKKCMNGEQFWNNRIKRYFPEISINNIKYGYKEFYMKIIKDKPYLKIGFRKDLVNIFHESRIAVDEIPDIDLKKRANDYIDFLGKHEVLYPIMKFVDVYTRPGFVFRIVGLTDDIINNSKKICRDIDGLLVMFKRYTDCDFWTVWCDCNVRNMIEFYHDKEHIGNKHISCKECPFVNYIPSTKLLKSLIDGSNNNFSLICI